MKTLPPKRKGVVWIYGLFENDKAVYIGQTSVPRIRARQHELSHDFSQCDFKLLEKTCENNAAQMESKLISHYRNLGCSLSNKRLRGHRPYRIWRPYWRHLGIKITFEMDDYLSKAAAQRLTQKSAIVREALLAHQKKTERSK